MHLRISTLPIVCPGQEMLNKIIPNRSQTLQGPTNVCWHCLQILCFIWPHQLPQATEPKRWWPMEGTFSTLLQKGDKNEYIKMLILNIKIVS
jgi:hypothetical protein